MGTTRRFWWNFLRMLVAMSGGMLLLGPLWSLVWPGHASGVEGMTLLMATNMTVGVGVWMVLRGHGVVAVGEMALAMYVPFLLLLVPYRLGVLPADGVLLGGHVLMLPCMLLAMVRRRDEHSRPVVRRQLGG
ncbi:hypothetical protein [Tenggerimyces flavus]|uniref:Flagellar biosynthetic protein FliP n=1 Tax=Tenggerimyces flavus TaxID=1708749 RepID=A0ABV7Y5W5_9ACTN|nr:hypothetical protein [Tenggerimyces flavus]MBM7785099.1 flagellar biosynthetic protein FliP [Tenggerimyces flavus]